MRPPQDRVTASPARIPLAGRWWLLPAAAVPLAVAYGLAVAAPAVQASGTAAVLAVPAALAVFFHRDRGDADPSARPPGWDRSTVAAAVAMAAMASNVLVLGPTWLPYGATVAVLAVALTRPRHGAVHGTDLLLAPLLAWGLVGTLAGRLLLGQDGNALAFFVPALVALQHWWAPLPLDGGRARRLTGVLLWVSVLYVVLSYLTLVQGVDILPADDFKHTRVYFVAMAAVAAVLLRRWLVLGGVVLMTVPSFLAYPALTFVLVLAVAGGIVIVVHGSRLVLLLGAAVVGLLGAYASISPDQIRSAYFDRVGKIDNTSTREVLLNIGLRKLNSSPIVGDLFAADIAVPSEVTGPDRLVPLHNDYLQMAVSGGVLGGGLFLLWTVLVLVTSVRLARRTRVQGRLDEARIALVVAVGLSGMLLTAAFNPILIDARNSLVFALLCSVVASLQMAEAPAGKTSSDAH